MKVTLNKLLFCFFALCLAALSGCSPRSSRENVDNQRPSQSSIKIGENVERAGVMPSADYLHWEQVGNKVAAERQMSDEDIDWAVAMMHKPSTNKTTVDTLMMGLFLSVRTFTGEQKQKVRDGVTPLLSSSSKLDQKYARAVLKRLG